MTLATTGAAPGRVPAGWRFEVHDDLLPGWDDLAAGTGGSFRERWVRLAQNRVPSPLRSFVLTDGAGPHLAMIGGVMPEPTGHVRFDPHRVLSGGSAAEGVADRGPHPWRDLPAAAAFPCLLMMFPGYETAPLGPGAHDRDAAAAFLAGLREWAAAHGVRGIAFLFVRDDHPGFLAALADAGYDVTHMACRGDLDVTWADLDGYVARLPRKRRFFVRRELRELAARGVRVRDRALAEDEPDLVGLRLQLMAKYGLPGDAAREAATLATLRGRFPPGDVVVVEAVRDGRPLAFALFVRDGDSWTSLMSGADYTADEGFTYFAVMFYRPAELAPRHGITRIVYGLGTLEAKRLRGCTMTDLWAAGSVVTPPEE
jgi:uncharacterized protein